MITIIRDKVSLANEFLDIQLTLTGDQDEPKKVLINKVKIFAS